MRHVLVPAAARHDDRLTPKNCGCIGGTIGGYGPIRLHYDYTPVASIRLICTFCRRLASAPEDGKAGAEPKLAREHVRC
jgi:hypothetical protein